MNANDAAPMKNNATISNVRLGAAAAARIETPIATARPSSRRYEIPCRDAAASAPSTAPAPSTDVRPPKPPAPWWNTLVAISGMTTEKLNASVPITAIISNGVRTIRSDHT